MIEITDCNPDVFFKLTSDYELSLSYDYTFHMVLVRFNIFMSCSDCLVLIFIGLPIKTKFEVS
jgi:hypothetical protein